MNQINAKIREAVYEATGNGELDDEFIIAAVNELSERTTAELVIQLDEMEIAFDVLGGRGVELADRIDAYRITLAAREASGVEHLRITNPK